MTLHHLTYIKTLFQALLFIILVPLVLWEVFKNPRGIGARVLGQGTVLP
jgi:hypothetical protein